MSKTSDQRLDGSSMGFSAYVLCIPHLIPECEEHKVPSWFWNPVMIVLVTILLLLIILTCGSEVHLISVLN
jgi:hypothetical protein